MKISFPMIDVRRKWAAAAIWYLLFCVGYLFTGNFHFREPFELRLSFVDGLVPFMGWTVWIYYSQYLLLFYCIWTAESSSTVSRMVWSISLASLISFIFFLIIPTTVPRIPAWENRAEQAAFYLLHSIDPPSNCFPSLHASIAWLAAASLKDEKKRAGCSALIWAAVISLSTLTTKQHYFVDLAGSAILIPFCRWCTRRV